MSKGVRSGDHGGHKTRPSRPIQRAGHSTSSQSCTGELKFARVKSFWNHSHCIAGKLCHLGYQLVHNKEIPNINVP